MKTREQLYKGEGAALLRLIASYHALEYGQVLRFLGKPREALKPLITSMVKQGRIHHDKSSDLLCDSPDSAACPDHGLIAAFWILLDFKERVTYHTCSDFPAKLHFFADELYEVVYVGEGQEAMMTHALSDCPADGGNRLIVLESIEQASRLPVQASAFCTTDGNGAVSYYQKK